MRRPHNDQPMTAVLLFGDTERSPALRHEVPLAILDSLMFCERTGRRYVLAKHLERSRIKRALPDAEILEYFDFGMKQLADNGLLPDEAEREVAVRAARHIELREATIPGDFPVALADRLRQEGIRLRIDDRAVQRRRRSKADAELDGIRAAQRAAEAGTSAAAQMLARARGISMALPTVPATVLDAVAPDEMGKASGINYMAQRFGTVFALAIASAAFAAHGQLGSPTGVTAGFGPALWTCACFAILAALSGIAMTTSRRQRSVQASPADLPIAA
jgi:hypothetical protein